MTAARVGFVLKGYPRLSESFIAQEIEALEQRGLRIDIWSLRHPTDKTQHPVHDRIEASVTYLPEYLHQEPFRVLTGFVRALGYKGFGKAFGTFWRDFMRDLTVNRIRRFGQACVLATEVPEAITHFHAHFLHTPSSVARYAAMMTGRRWSFSAHAKDIWTIPDWEKTEKLEDAAFGVTCTAQGAAHLNALGKPNHGPVDVMLHGIDMTRFQGSETRAAHKPLRLVSVGRAVPKKGYAHLIDALAALPPDLDWTFEHIGGGDLRPMLKRQAEEAGLAERMIWRGARPQMDVIELLGRADIFLLASENQPDGDQDGIPNVILEAMAMGVPVVATHAGAIPEAIRHEQTGLLASPGDAWGIARAITALAHDETKRAHLASAGAASVREKFDYRPWADKLFALFKSEVPETVQ